MGRSLADRWNRIRGTFTLQDLTLDVTGKILVGLGLGALLAEPLRPYTWGLIGIGLGCSAIVKAKYWKKFWA